MPLFISKYTGETREAVSRYNRLGTVHLFRQNATNLDWWRPKCDVKGSYADELQPATEGLVRCKRCFPQ